MKIPELGPFSRMQPRLRIDVSPSITVESTDLVARRNTLRLD